MSVFKLKSTIRIPCAKRIAPYLQQEIDALGYKITWADETGAEIEGTLADCMRLNMYLRTAFRVLFLVDEFVAEDAKELYAQASEIPWEEYIPADGYVSISSHVDNETIRDNRFANLRLKDALVDRMQKKNNRRPDSGPETDRTVLFLFWKGHQAMVFIDTSGETIAKHSYRRNPMKAPLQEALAAALLLASKWDRDSPLVNPMCGSGTIAIEAALLASDKAPGLMRPNFGFMHVKGYDPLVWKEIKTEAARKIRPQLPFPIIASDIHPRAVRAAEDNARQARVDHLIKFRVCSFEDTPIPSKPGVVIMNPEYGERLGSESDLESVYSGIGDFFKQKCAGYTGYVFTATPELAKKIGLKTSRKIPFYNAILDARLLEFELYTGTRRVITEESQQ